MKRILILLLALLLLTGCASAPAGSAPDTELSAPESFTAESSEGRPESTDETVSTESTFEGSVPAGPDGDPMPEGMDTLAMLPQYNWYDAGELNVPGEDHGDFALTEDQQAQLRTLLHPYQWDQYPDCPAVGVTVTLCAKNSSGDVLNVCPWDGATLILLEHYPASGEKTQTCYLAPIWINDDAKVFMQEVAYTSFPDPQTLEDLSPLCRYPNTLSPEFMAHIAAVEDVYAITLSDPFLSDYSDLYMPLYYATATATPWESAEEIPADDLLRGFRFLYFQAYRMDEKFLIDAAIVEPILQQYFNVSAQHLRSAECFIRDAGCYRMGGADGLGGPISGPTMLQRTGDNSYRLILEFSESARDGYYFAFEFELTDTGFRYLRSNGTLYYEEHPLPEV